MLPKILARNAFNHLPFQFPAVEAVEVVEWRGFEKRERERNLEEGGRGEFNDD